MKVRSGFVSNSSSSSFLVIDAQSGYDIPKLGTNLIVDCNLGTTKFNWERETHEDFGTKVIFAYLQTYYADNASWLNMLEKVICENTGINYIVWFVHDHDYDDPNYGYIDHASSAEEGANTEMFDSEEMLKDFLFGKGSYIQVCNDNE
jgi:hypothetical protein